MVFLGQWPFQHTITIDKLFVDTNVKMAYYIDKDKIISEAEINSLVSKGYVYIDKFHIISSSEMSDYIAKLIPQYIPPEVPKDKVALINSNANVGYEKIIGKIKKSAALVLVGNNDSTIMTDIGASWNDHFSTWILDINHLKILKENHKKNNSSNITVQNHLGGNVLISGDTSTLVDVLNEVGATLQNNGTWIVSSKKYHLIAPHIKKK